MSKENKPEVNKQEQTQTLSEILQVRRDKLKYFQDEGRDPFKQTRFDRTAWSAEIKSSYEEFENKDVKVCGRIMAKRGMGKAIFCHIKDDRGQIQLYIRADAVSEQEFKDFRKYDIGDIIGVEGYVFKTKTEEITVHVSKVVLLSKSLRPLPEKFHGMTNIELKYRQRYVDLIMSDESRRNFEIRSKFISYIRKYLDNRSFSREKIIEYEFVQTKEADYLAFLTKEIMAEVKQPKYNEDCRVICSLFAQRVNDITTGKDTVRLI